MLLIDRIVAVLALSGPMKANGIASHPHLADVSIAKIKKCIWRNSTAGRRLMRQGELIRQRH